MDERRYYGLDALRGAMMMLGIVLHAAMFYIVEPLPAMPLPTDRNTAYVFDLSIVFIHSFRMQTFFVLAGFFAALLVAKRGLGGTYKNRASRILAPLLVGAVTIVPLTALLVVDFFLSARFGTHDLLPDAAALQVLAGELKARGVPVEEPSLAHLWFLEYLCLFYLLIPLCRSLVRHSLAFESALQRWLRSPYPLLVFGLASAGLLWPYQGGQVMGENTYLKPHLPSLAYFGFFFVLGYVFHHYRAFLPALAQGVALRGGFAVVLFPLAWRLSQIDIGMGGTSFAVHLAAVLANGLLTWTLVLLAIGCAMRFFDRQSPWIQYIAQSAYWVYLVHLPLVLFAGWWLVPFDLPAVVKFPLVFGFTAAVALVTFHYWVQKSWISDFLHGCRFALDWPWRQPALGQVRPAP